MSSAMLPRSFHFVAVSTCVTCRNCHKVHLPTSHIQMIVQFSDFLSVVHLGSCCRAWYSSLLQTGNLIAWKDCYYMHSYDDPSARLLNHVKYPFLSGIDLHLLHFQNEGEIPSGIHFLTQFRHLRSLSLGYHPTLEILTELVEHVSNSMQRLLLRSHLHSRREESLELFALEGDTASLRTRDLLRIDMPRLSLLLHLPYLETLCLRNVECFTQDFFCSLSVLSFLRELDVSESNVDDAMCQALSRKATLRTLILQACPHLTGRALVYVLGINQLNNLSISAVSQRFSLSSSFEVTSAQKRHMKISAEDIARWQEPIPGRASFMTTVRVDYYDNDGTNMVVLESLIQLFSLTCRLEVRTDRLNTDAWRILSKSVTLKSLSLSGRLPFARKYDSLLLSIAPMSFPIPLAMPTLWHRMRSFASAWIPGLRSYDISLLPLSSPSCAPLSVLRVLRLQCLTVSDEDIKRLAGACPELVEFSLIHCNSVYIPSYLTLDDAKQRKKNIAVVIDILRRWSHLESFHLQCLPFVSIEEVMKILRSTFPLSRLRTLYFQGHSSRWSDGTAVSVAYRKQILQSNLDFLQRKHLRLIFMDVERNSLTPFQLLDVNDEQGICDK